MEHLDALVVGAGLSGVAAGHHLRTTCGWADFAIFEARDAIGGTWDLFRYPGIRSDSDMFTLGYPFRPWTDPEGIADGDAILAYIEDTAADEGIDRHIRLHHRVVAADWDSGSARWHITAERGDPGDPAAPWERLELTCSFLFSCTGYYRYDHGYLPDFEGMDRFGGTIVHPQEWPEDLDYEGKEVVVIGSGATAVTLIPAMAGTAGHITMLQRSPTYVVAGPRRSGIAALAHRWLPTRVAGELTRWVAALGTQGFYRFCQRFPKLARRMLRKGVERHLPEGYDIDRHFEPTYDPWDQRVCLAPDGDIFRAIRHGEASVVTDRIETFTEDGIALASGEELAADIIITATGLELLFLGGIELSVDGEEVDVSERLTWKGMMLEGVPNMAMSVGYTNASWTLRADLTCDAVARLLNELRSRHLAVATPVNEDATLETEPLLVLQAGYIRRAVDRLPKQGARAPWRVNQSYLADYRAMKRSDLVGEGLVLSHPVGEDRSVRAGSPDRTTSSTPGRTSGERRQPEPAT